MSLLNPVATSTTPLLAVDDTRVQLLRSLLADCDWSPPAILRGRLQQAMAQISGAQKSNVKAGDSLTFEYRLVKPDEQNPLKADKIVVKAKNNGEDVLSPMIEAVATAVVGAVAQP